MTKVIPTFLLLFISTFSFAQLEQVNAFGAELIQSILNADSTGYSKLVMPKEAVMELVKSEYGALMSAEDLEATLQGVSENYGQIVAESYMPYFSNLLLQQSARKLELEATTFEIVTLEPSEDYEGVIAVLGKVPHKGDYQFLTCFLSEYEGKLYLSEPEILIDETNRFKQLQVMSEVELSADEEGFIQSVGRIDVDGASKGELLNCITDGIVVVGIEENSSETGSKADYEFITGQWDYSYYVNDIEDYIGSVAFKFTFKFFDGYLTYEYYDFVHTGGDSDRASLGQLPAEINDGVLKIFTEAEWAEITNDVLANQIAVVRRAGKALQECFE